VHHDRNPAVQRHLLAVPGANTSLEAGATLVFAAAGVVVVGTVLTVIGVPATVACRAV
jgi:hypothetical protein